MLETTFSSALTDQQFGQFVDVDFPIEAQRRQRMMGANPREEAAGAAGIPKYSDLADVVPQAQWKEMIEAKNAKGGMLRPLVRAIKDQDGEPSCVSNAFLSAHEIKQNELLGPDLITELSPISVYRFVGSPRSGSTLTANMKRMLDVGALPLDNAKNKAKYKHTHPHNGYSKSLPSGWEETAALFKNAEYADIENWNEFVTALLNGHPVIYARSGHCILGIGLSYRSGGLYLEYLNSWSMDWGAPVNEHLTGGCGFDSERVAKSASYGAMALLSVQVPITQAA